MYVCMLFQLLVKAHTVQWQRKWFRQITVRVAGCKIVMAMTTEITGLFSVNTVQFRRLQ